MSRCVAYPVGPRVLTTLPLLSLLRVLAVHRRCQSIMKVPRRGSGSTVSAGSSLAAAADRLRVPVAQLKDLQSAAVHDWVVISGKMASGKDTVAAELDRIRYNGAAITLRYGDLMRRELDQALAAWRANPKMGTNEVIESLAHSLRLDFGRAGELAQALYDDFETSQGQLTAWDRTNGLRFALQSLGGSWRSAEDPDYWARMAALNSMRARANAPVLLTGGRFEPDVEIPSMLGALVLRIDVSEQVQLDRLRTRDGLSPDPETLRHPGETLLDSWPGFTSRIDGNRSLKLVTSDAVAAIARRHGVAPPAAEPLCR